MSGMHFFTYIITLTYAPLAGLWNDSTRLTGPFFTTAGLTSPRSIGLIFSAAIKRYGGISTVISISVDYPSPHMVIPSSAEREEMLKVTRKKTETAGEDFKEYVRENCTTEEEIIQASAYFAARLAAEGFLPPATKLLAALFKTFPNAAEHIPPYIRWGFEFLWNKAGHGHRPGFTGWEKPTEGEMEEAYVGMRGDYPEGEEEKRGVLDTLGVMVELGDRSPRGYGLATGVAVAVELGEERMARELLVAL